MSWWFYRVWDWSTGTGQPRVVAVLPQIASPAAMHLADLAFLAVWRPLLKGASCRVLADRVSDAAAGTPGSASSYLGITLLVGQPCAVWSPP